MIDLPYGRQSIDDGDVEAVVAALTSDWLTTGPRVDAFESEIARLVGLDEPAVSVTSGTAALHVAYAALGIGPGDRVVTTPLTFVATAAAAVQLGARVDFVDVEEDTGLLDPGAVAAAVTPATRVVAGVDYAGVPIDVPALKAAAGDGVAVLEDAAHSIGARRAGRAVGAEADVTTFSFFPTKNLTTAEGGAVVSPSRDVLAAARSFKNHGLVRDRAAQRRPDEGSWHQEVHRFGLNYRLPDVLAALGSSQLARLARFAARRAEIKRRYDEALADLPGVTLPAVPSDAEPVWHLYPFRVELGRRREIFDRLRSEGIGVQVNYLPVYRHPVFEDLGFRAGLCPVAEEYYAREISLPMFPGLSDGDVDRVIDAVRRAHAA